MLHKSFKPAKCKTSLKLATSRIKLMRNKKGVQITQMKRDLAQLLETGQDRTARIRVEHVIREEKMVAAYDLVEIYCELIVARMPIIESQKTCPIDLKEAVTSVIFAAPRCSDISELADIKKQFTAKYGKEFVSAALELRPESGVSRMLVEKLSAVAPDIQTKVKVLTGVAKEHNINWEPTSFEEKESNPPNDLLNGAVNFESASMANAIPPKIHQPSNINHHEKKPDPSLDFAEQNRKYVVDNGVGTSSSGVTSERMETRGDGQNWNMEFKDATSAAEAAAESAERAAMAARAAAQFASHEKNPSKDKSPHVSYESSSGDYKPKIPNQQTDRNEHERKDSERFHEANTRSSKSNVSKESFTEFDKKESFRKPKMINQQTDRNEHERKDSERLHESNTRSSNSNVRKESFTEFGKKESFSGDRKPKIMNNQQTDRNEHEQKDTERFHEANKRSNISSSFLESKTELESGKKEDFESENINLFAQETIKNKKQPSAHSSSSGDEVDDEIVSDRLIGKRIVVGNPFAVVDERNIFSESSRTNSGVDDKRDEVAFDDDNGPKFDTGFEYDEVNLESSHIWSPKRHDSIKIQQTSSQSHLFSQSQSFGQHSTKSMEPSETDDRGPVSFDHSDSESESDKKSNSKAHDLFVTNLEPSRKSRIELNDLVEKDESSFYDEEKKQPSRQSSSILLEKHESSKKHELDQKSYDTIEDNDDFMSRSDDLDFGNEVKFGTLTGGLKNKGGVLRYPPYTKSREESSTSSHKRLDSKVSRIEDKKPSVSVSFDSDSDDYSDKFPVHSSNTRSRISPPAAFFGDDDETASEKEVPKQAPSSVRLRTELSRRTRGSPSVSSFRNRVDREPKTVISSISEDTKPSLKSHADEIPAQHRSNASKTEEIGSYESQRKPKKESPFAPPVNHFLKTKQEAIDKVPELTQRKSDEMGKKESGKTEKLVVENSVKKPSYVHPKLPDYDTFAARLQSLRDERK